MSSIWTKDCELPHFDSLKKDIKTDVLVIGGGIAGILCTYMLKQAGIDCVLAEARTLCSGMTQNTTAKITFQHGLFCHKLLAQYGREKARMYLEANREALEQYRKLCRDIPCDFEEKDAFVYSENNRKILEEEISALEKTGFQADFCETVPLPFPVAGAIRFKNQAQFHPLKFLAAIAEGLPIYENTFVRALSGHTAVTSHGTITAEKIIVTTHFPFLNSHGSYFLKLYQHRSYVLVLENASDLHGMYVSDSLTGMSFRNFRQYTFIGGGGHRSGKQGGSWSELKAFADRYYPDSREVCRFAAQDCMPLDLIPYIGHYSRSTPDLFVATGFHKWGMTSSMAAARILTDMILERENPYAPVFSPSRNILKPQLAVNAAEATANLLTFSSPRCPHMGCALKWNSAEHSWDCPCHGSRFDENGKLCDNPAMKNLKF